MKPQELIKAILEGVGKLIDARAKTTEEVLKAEFRGEVRSSIKALEEKHSKKFDLLISEVSKNINVVQEVKTGFKEIKVQVGEAKTGISELKTDINGVGQGVTDVKSDLKALRTGVAKKLVEQDERLEAVEKATGTSSKH